MQSRMTRPVFAVPAALKALSAYSRAAEVLGVPAGDHRAGAPAGQPDQRLVGNRLNAATRQVAVAWWP